MELTSEQKAAVAKWVADGEGLGEVQRRIKDEFGVEMTYMDVRFLVLDIGATVKDKEEPKPAQPTPQPAPQADGEDLDEAADAADASADAADGDLAASDGEPAAKVSVTLDKVVRAGAMMSGTVTFSDGVEGGWMLDRLGRLALTKISQPGYQPTDADLEAFQLELQAKLSSYR